RSLHPRRTRARTLVGGPPPDRPHPVRPVHGQHVFVRVEGWHAIRYSDRSQIQALPAPRDRDRRQPEPQAESRLLSARRFSLSLRHRFAAAAALVFVAGAACGGTLSPRPAGNPPPDRPTLPPTYRP